MSYVAWYKLADVSEVLTASIRAMIAVKIETVRISETTVSVRQSTRGYIPKGSHLHEAQNLLGCTAVLLMMEAARTSETSVDIQLITRQYIPEDSELHTSSRENLKSHIFIKFKVFWDVAPCSHFEVARRFRGVYCLRHQGDESVRTSETSVPLMMEAVRASETSVDIQLRTRQYIP
jgi:hypothetical protein